MLTSPRSLAALAALLVAVTSAAACSSDDDGPEGGDSDQPRVVQLGAPGATNRELTGDELEALAEAPTYTAADVAFVQNMIPHHEQALAMTAMVADRTSSPALPQLAERMDISQRDEIVQLQAWLTERGEPVPDEHHQHEQMPGMLTDAELAQLEAARGREFDELFLQYMIRHHEGAVIMVESLLTDAAGGQEPAIFQLAQHIASDQQIEISRMKQLLVEM